MNTKTTIRLQNSQEEEKEKLSKSFEQKNNKKEEEIWRDIKDYEGLYQVSNLGRVKSLERVALGMNGSKRTIRGRILKPSPNYSGYLHVVLSDGSGERKNFLVHRLVCKAFHENPENKPCVNHLDENKTNNATSNLEWCTVAENNNHGTRRARSAKAQSKTVGQYTFDGELIKVWKSIKEVERQLGFSISNISNVCRGKRKTAYGYVWKYIDEGK